MAEARKLRVLYLLLAVFLLALLLYFLFFDGSSSVFPEELGQLVEVELALPDMRIRSIDVLSPLTLRIVKGAQELRVMGNEASVKNLNIRVLDEGLEISTRQGNFASPSLRLQIPALDWLGLGAAGRVTVSGFTGDILEIFLAGVGQLKIEDSEYRLLQLHAEGASEIDAHGLKLHDALVDLKGATTIKLWVEGGVLSGRMKGLGTLKYRGNAREEVQVDGLGQIERY